LGYSGRSGFHISADVAAKTCVVDPERFNPDPDPTFSVVPDPDLDPTFQTIGKNQKIIGKL
jgi:hypothetical protein